MDAIGSEGRSIPALRDGIDRNRWVSIRPIEGSDAPGLSDLYARLLPESKRRRFLGYGDLDGALARAFAEREGQGFVAVLDEPGPNDGQVVAHASLQPDGLGVAEIAFAVADEPRATGLARRSWNLWSSRPDSSACDD